MLVNVFAPKTVCLSPMYGVLLLKCINFVTHLQAHLIHVSDKCIFGLFDYKCSYCCLFWLVYYGMCVAIDSLSYISTQTTWWDKQWLCVYFLFNLLTRQRIVFEVFPTHVCTHWQRVFDFIILITITKNVFGNFCLYGTSKGNFCADRVKNNINWG